MSFATHSQQARFHAAPIVAHQDAQVTRGIVDFHFNLSGAGVAECVKDRFARDEVGLIADQRAQESRLAFRSHLKINAWRQRKFFGQAGQSVFQAVGRGLGSAQRAKGIAALLAHLD